jgi:2-polyprenyl-6-methoxyphenol hydroxylase-like FAD-dependent oxidoreductase
MGDIRRVLVAGGGLGGLAAALAFAGRGVEATVIERRPDFDIPGIGLGQPANALRVYDALGVLDEILDTGFVYDHMTIFDAGRHLIAAHKFRMGDRRAPPFCALPRSGLHGILLRAAQKAGVTVRLGVHVTAVDEANNEGASVVFSDGAAATFDLMAGFDGIRSTARTHLYGTMFVPRHSGCGAWRLQAPKDACVTGMEFLQGIEGKVGAMPIGRDLMYLFNVRPESPAFFHPAGAVHDPGRMAALFAERLAQFGSYVAGIRAALDAESGIVYSPIEPLLVPWPWHRGRVVIGGDAAHVFPPHLTQGAAMAVEDAIVLAQEVIGGDGPVDARLMRYARKRYARCAFVYTFSLQWMEQEQSIRTPEQMEAARRELALNASDRIAVSDRILDARIF